MFTYVFQAVGEYKLNSTDYTNEFACTCVNWGEDLNFMNSFGK